MASAQQLAVRYDRYAALLRDYYGTPRWRRELVTVRTFMVWIESFWEDDAPQEPVMRPDAVSASGSWIPVRWYEVGPHVLGYTSSLRGCYRVPASEAPPALSPSPAAKLPPASARTATAKR